ncbi:MAG: esterase-like activity of phytase family protein [Paracoccaceae bacterium]
MRRRIAPLALLLALCGSAFAQPHLVEESNLRLRLDDSNFGGLSGLVMGAGGLDFVAVTDRGHFVTGHINREDGVAQRAEIIALTPILDSKGNPLDGYNTDAEGLARLPNGALIVSFEGNHRIMRHNTLHAAGEFLPSTEAFGALQNNSGLEALAVDAAEIVYTIPERSGRLTQPFPVYRLINGTWDETMSLPRRGEFLVVGADIDGADLYILERYYLPFGGFQSRIRRFTIAGNALVDEVELMTSRLGQYDNLEGLDAWRDAAGVLRLSVVSDDNFRFYQRNQLVEFRLED